MGDKNSSRRASDRRFNYETEIKLIAYSVKFEDSIIELLLVVGMRL